MSIRSLLGNGLLVTISFSGTRSNGQPLERSQLAHTFRPRATRNLSPDILAYMMQQRRALRYSMLTLLVLGGIVNFLDRSAVSVANTTLRGDLHLSATQIGALLSAFSLAYGVAQLPAGWLLDRFGPRSVLSAGMLLWSVAQMATGTVSGFASLVATRVGLGVGEAPFFPGGVKVIRDWYAEPERGVPMGVLNASTTLGQAMAPPVLTLLMLAYGWRSMFVWIGVLGVVVSVAWFLTYRAPASPASLFTSARKNRVLEAPAQVSGTDVVSHPLGQRGPKGWGTSGKVTLRAWLRLFRQRTLWGMMLGFSGVNYTAWLYLAWVPGYLEAAHHVSLRATGWLAALPFLMGSAGMLVNGVVADGLVRKGRDPLRSRKILIVAGMVCSAACTLLVPRAETGAGAAAVIGMALFFIHFAGTSAWGLVQTAVPAHLVATVGATQNFCSFLFASAAPVVTGWFLDRTHLFDVALMICAGVTFLGASAYWVLVRDGISG